MAQRRLDRKVGDVVIQARFAPPNGTYVHVVPLTGTKVERIEYQWPTNPRKSRRVEITVDRVEGEDKD